MKYWLGIFKFVLGILVTIALHWLIIREVTDNVLGMASFWMCAFYSVTFVGSFSTRLYLWLSHNIKFFDREAANQLIRDIRDKGSAEEKVRLSSVVFLPMIVYIAWLIYFV